MTERLLVMKGLLKPTGSIYFHCDPTASHYVKALMDAIFGHENFLNEIIWHYQTGGVSKRWFGKKHDVLLLYTKSKDYKFYPERVMIPRTPEVIRRIKTGGENATRAKNLHKYPDDVFEIQALNAMAKERLGYPTQKPISLLRRITLASSDKDDVILDPFCGCATTIAAAHELERGWIGVDIAYHAIRRVVQARLLDQYRLVEGENYTVDGIPKTEEAATDLWRRDKYQFQRWAVETVDGFITTKKTNDGGIDGRIYISIPDSKNLASMIVEVKGGENVGIGVVRELRGAMERSGAEMAGLIVRAELGETKKRNFSKEMASAGAVSYTHLTLPTNREV